MKYNAMDDDHKMMRMKSPTPIPMTRADGAIGTKMFNEEPIDDIFLSHLYHCKIYYL